MRNTRSNDRRRGASALEFAVVSLVLFIVVFAIFEYMRYTMHRHILENAVREGARTAVVGNSYLTTKQIRQTVEKYLGDHDIQNLNIKVYKINPATGEKSGGWKKAKYNDLIAVEVTGIYNPILPTFGFLPDFLNIEARAMMRCEASESN